MFILQVFHLAHIHPELHVDYVVDSSLNQAVVDADHSVRDLRHAEKLDAAALHEQLENHVMLQRPNVAQEEEGDVAQA
jgi:hypothetical protein